MLLTVVYGGVGLCLAFHLLAAPCCGDATAVLVPQFCPFGLNHPGGVQNTSAATQHSL